MTIISLDNKDYLKQFLKKKNGIRGTEEHHQFSKETLFIDNTIFSQVSLNNANYLE
jgi:hypothetical protein